MTPDGIVGRVPGRPVLLGRPMDPRVQRQTIRDPEPNQERRDQVLAVQQRPGADANEDSGDEAIGEELQCESASAAALARANVLRRGGDAMPRIPQKHTENRCRAGGDDDKHDSRDDAGIDHLNLESDHQPVSGSKRDGSLTGLYRLRGERTDAGQ